MTTFAEAHRAEILKRLIAGQMPNEIAAWFNTLGFAGSGAALNGHIKMIVNAGMHTGITARISNQTGLHGWTTLLDNLIDGYCPAHEVSHRDCPPATRPGGGQSIGPGGSQSTGPGGEKTVDRDRTSGLNTDTMRPYDDNYQNR